MKGQPHYCEDRTVRIRTMRGPPVLVFGLSFRFFTIDNVMNLLLYPVIQQKTTIDPVKGS